MATVLICDDNIAVHESLSTYLREMDIRVLSVYNGEDALKLLRSESIQLLILDLMLPGPFGTEILKELRRFSDIPVIILSARDSEFDRIFGLELGADDYVVKPFSPKEVATRVTVILRRFDKRPDHKKQFSFTNLFVDREAYTATVGGEKLELTAKELEVLSLFAENPNTALSRERIMNAVWGYDYYNDTRAVDTQIMRLRQKIPPQAEFSIRSIYGVGYRMEKK